MSRAHLTIVAFPTWSGGNRVRGLEYQWSPENEIWPNSMFDSHYQIIASAEKLKLQRKTDIDSKIESIEKENVKKFVTKEGLKEAVRAAIVAECEIYSQIEELSKPFLRQMFSLDVEQLHRATYEEFYEVVQGFSEIYEGLASYLDREGVVAMLAPVPIVPVWRPDGIAAAFKSLVEYARCLKGELG